MSQRLSSLVDGRAAYDVVLADPPWPMWGDPNKDAAAGKHYSLMTTEQIHDMPVRGLFREKGALFLWATCPRLSTLRIVFAVEAPKTGRSGTAS
jgi:N6-adenosine-specific RNA methylase IME4